MKWKDTWLWDTQLSDRQDLIRQFEDSATSLNIVPAHRSNENNENIVSQFKIVMQNNWRILINGKKSTIYA